MSFMSRHRFRNLGTEALSDDTLRVLAPSIFAEDKHESRSERYAYIPTSEIVAGMRGEGFEPVFAKQGNSRIPGKAEYTKHLVRFRHKGEIGIVRQVGGIYPEVVIVNSHDGTSAYKVMAGLMRLICLNGLMVSDKELASVSVHHKGDIMGQVIEGSYSVLSESRRAVEAADAWAGITLNRDEQMILASAAHEIRFGEESATPIEADQLLTPRRREDIGNDLWRVGNVLQENAIRGGLRAWGRDANGQRRRVSSREVKAIDADVKINRALWRLNEEMARLKGGGAPMDAAA